MSEEEKEIGVGQYDVDFDAQMDVVDEDWLAGVSCNPDAPEECESCQ